MKPLTPMRAQVLTLEKCLASRFLLPPRRRQQASKKCRAPRQGNDVLLTLNKINHLGWLLIRLSKI
jgi:hypothetical protein